MLVRSISTHWSEVKSIMEGGVGGFWGLFIGEGKPMVSASCNFKRGAFRGRAVGLAGGDYPAFLWRVAFPPTVMAGVPVPRRFL